MNYLSNVSWSKKYVIITIIIVLLVIGIGVSFLLSKQLSESELIVLGLLSTVLICVFSLVPTKIEIKDGFLFIHRISGKKSIKIDSIKESGLSHVPLSIKLCGSGGLCGNIGWYRAAEFGLYFSYVLDDSKSFYIVLENGRRYMLSCDNPDEIISILANSKK